jgi:hypothetical protein
VVERTRWNLRKSEKRDNYGGQGLHTLDLYREPMPRTWKTSDILYDREFHCNTKPILRIGTASQSVVMCQLYRSIEHWRWAWRVEQHRCTRSSVARGKIAKGC